MTQDRIRHGGGGAYTIMNDVYNTPTNWVLYAIATQWLNSKRACVGGGLPPPAAAGLLERGDVVRQDRAADASHAHRPGVALRADSSRVAGPLPERRLRPRRRPGPSGGRAALQVGGTVRSSLI